MPQHWWSSEAWTARTVSSEGAGIGHHIKRGRIMSGHPVNASPLSTEPGASENCGESGGFSARRGRHTPLRAVRAFCLWCCLDSAHEVWLCPAEDCPLWPLRMGRGVPRGYSVLKAIRRRCVDCTGYETKRTRECVFGGVRDELCPLWPYRMGHRPKGRSE